MALDARLVTDRERTLFTIGAIFSGLVWAVAILGTFGLGLILGLSVGAFILMAHALFLAHVRGNGVRVTQQQLPELYERCQAAAKKLGMAELPDTYLLQSGGVLNAFATKLLSRKFIVIYSGLVANCEDPRELDFVIGHELGHHAAGHLKWNAFLIPFQILPWLGPAYSRAREYTCDRAGYAVVEDVEVASRALVVLAAGGKMASKVNLQAFADQRLSSGHFWMATMELNLSHPYLCKRVAAIQEFKAPGTVAAVGRNPWAYPLAPFFAVATGGSVAASLMVMVAVTGVMAAVAIPNFTQYKQRVREAGERAEQQQQQLFDEMKKAEEPDALDAVPTPEAEAPPAPPVAVPPGPKHHQRKH